MRKKRVPSRRFAILFCIPVCTVLLGLLAFHTVQHATYRLTYFVSIIPYIGMLGAMVRGIARRESGYLIWFAAVQYFYWGAGDIVLAFALGHFPDNEFPFQIEPETHLMIQIVWAVLLLSISVLASPVARHLFRISQAKIKDSSYNVIEDERKTRNGALLGSIFGIMLVRLIRQIPDKKIAFLFDAIIFLGLLFGTALIGWMALFHYRNETN